MREIQHNCNELINPILRLDQINFTFNELSFFYNVPLIDIERVADDDVVVLF